MFEGIYTEHTLMHPTIRAYPQYPQNMSGVTLGSQMIYRYSLDDSDYPTLVLANYLFDGELDFIQPGHYELALSDDWDYFILLQSKEPKAVFPVIKVEEDASEVERLKDPKNKKRMEKEAKEREKINKKRAKVGMPEDKEKIYMEANIEYVEDGHYYLVKYVRGTIKAWGVIKR